MEYFVTWKGYDSSENTWEPIQNVCRTKAFAVFEHQGIPKLETQSIITMSELLSRRFGHYKPAAETITSIQNDTPMQENPIETTTSMRNETSTQEISMETPLNDDEFDCCPPIDPTEMFVDASLESKNFAKPSEPDYTKDKNKHKLDPNLGYKCTECRKRFKRSDYLRVHLKIHEK